MPKNKQLNKTRRAALVLQARAGLIPASDDIADEQRARMSRTAHIGRTVKAYAKLVTCGSEDLAITSILAELRLYCDSNGLVFHELDAAAFEYYREETAENCISNPAE